MYNRCPWPEDLIVLAGNAGVEAAAKAAGHAVDVPFTPGRTDATAERDRCRIVRGAGPQADGFRNWRKAAYSVSPEEMLVDKAQLLTLSAPEMTVLVGGLRVLGANHGGNTAGVFTQRSGHLTPDFFTHLVDMSTAWRPVGDNAYEGRCRQTGAVKWTATRGLGLWRQLAIARHCRGVRPGRQRGQVCARFRESLDQGDEPGPV